MAAVKGKDTKPEMIVRKYLFSRGLRYRVNNRKLPGSPDIVFRKYKTVVFVDGCFWHGHENCRFYRLPKTNADYWRHKIFMNIARDYANNIYLKMAGWKVIRIWECEIKTKERREVALQKLYNEIIGLLPQKSSYDTPADSPSIAAEPDSSYGKSK